MALVPCRECSREVSNQARTCPHCGIGDPGNSGLRELAPKTSQTAGGSLESEGEKRQREGDGCGGAVAVLAILAFIAVVFLLALGSSGGDDQMDVLLACQQSVRNQLVSPSTASFPAGRSAVRINPAYS